MQDERASVQPADPTRVQVYDANELGYWTRLFGVDAERLREVVAQVGPSADAVRRRLSDSALAE